MKCDPISRTNRGSVSAADRASDIFRRLASRSRRSSSLSVERSAVYSAHLIARGAYGILKDELWRFRRRHE